MKSKLVLETWTSLKDKIGELIDNLTSQKEINEQIVTNYQTKLRTKEETIRELESRVFAGNFVSEVRKEINLMVKYPLPVNSSNEQILESLKIIRQDLRRQRGLDPN